MYEPPTRYNFVLFMDLFQKNIYKNRKHILKISCKAQALLLKFLWGFFIRQFHRIFPITYFSGIY